MTVEKKLVHVGGRGNTPYKPELDEQAYNYCLLGAMDEDLARFFAISVRTLSKWKKKYPSLRESIRVGKEFADMQVVKSLYKRAIGYTYRQVVSQATKVPASKVKIEGTMDGTFMTDGDNGFQTIKVTTKEVVPDTRAQIFWLKNRQPKFWREKQEIDHTTDGKKMPTITIFELPNDGRND
jgi:hypothetical protein